MTIALRTHLLTAAVILAGVGAVPASAQLLGGQGVGAIDAAGNLEATLSGGGNLGADRIGSAAGRITNSVKGAAGASSRHKVDTRSGHVATDTALDGSVSHSADAALGNGGAAGGSANSTGSAGASAGIGVSADLVGTDQIKRTAGAARRTASGAAGQARTTASGAVSASRAAADRTAGFAHRKAANTVGATRRHAGAAIGHGRHAVGAAQGAASGALGGTAAAGSVGLSGSASVSGSGSADAGTPRR